MEINVEKIKSFSATIFLQLIFGSLIPGILFIFLFNRDLFFTLDIFRLITLSISITAPVLTINSFLILIVLALDHPPQNEYKLNKLFSLMIYGGSFITNLVLYFTILIGYLNSYTIKKCVFVAIEVEIYVAISFLVIGFYLKIRKINFRQLGAKIFKK